jgi:two-component system, response regulator RegA
MRREPRVLLVDDEEVFTDNVAKLLLNRGYKVKAVNNGAAALVELEEDDFDVMVLDLKMPGMDGLTTLKEALKLELRTEVLILTGHGAVDSAIDALKLGALEYMTKPCEIDELVEKIEEAAEKKFKADEDEIGRKVKLATESSLSALSFFGKKKKR